MSTRTTRSTTFCPRFCRQKITFPAPNAQKNPPGKPKQTHNNQKLTTNHHNSPQNPKTRFIHNQVVRPHLLTLVSPGKPQVSPGNPHLSAEGATHTSLGQPGVPGGCSLPAGVERPRYQTQTMTKGQRPGLFSLLRKIAPITPNFHPITLKSHADSAFATPILGQKSRIEVLD